MKLKRWVILIGLVLLSFIPAAYAPVWYGSGDDSQLLGRWSCEGNFKDSSGQGNHGTQSGGVTITTGAKGRGCGFDGVNDMINLSSDLLLDDITNWTVSAWVKSPSSGTQVILAHRDGNPAYNFFAIASSVIAYRHYNNTWSFEYGTINVVDNNWHLLTWVNNGSSKTIDMYVDGRLDVTKNSEIISGTGVVNRIGVLYGGAAWFYNGTMDEFRVYNRSLSQSEVSSLYNTTKTYKIQMYTTPVKGVLNDTPSPTATDETGLVGYWKLNGDVVDSSGKGNDGVITSATSTSAGRWSSAYDFDGIDDKINITQPNWNLLNTSITVSVWAKPNIVNSWTQAGLLTKRVNGGNQWDLGITNIGNVRFNVFNVTDSYSYAYGGTAEAGKWNHIVGTYDNANIKVYLNGVQVHTSPWTSPISGAATNICAGVEITNGRYFNGTIDEIRIYNRSLSDSEIKELYLSKGLVGYWKMDADQRNATSTFDSSGYNNHGLITGATFTNEGRFKEGYKFDGSNDFITVSHSNSVTYNNSGNFSWGGWFNPSVLSPYNVYIAKANSLVTAFRNSDYTLWLYTGKWYCAMGNVSIYDETSSPTNATVGQWQHVMCVRNNTGLYLFVNGAPQGTPDTSLIIGGVDTTNPLYIGKDNGGSYPVNGTIDEVRIYNRALTATEVAGLYNGTQTYHWRIKTVPG